MKKKTFAARLASAGLALWFAMIACTLPNTASVGDLRTESHSIDLGSASTARVQIEFPAGELKVESGASSLMEGSFRYNAADWEPQVSYTQNGTQGDLLINQKDDTLSVGDRLVIQWDIQLNEEVPIELNVRTGAGTSDLALGKLNLTGLTIETGVGVTTVDLNGVWLHDVEVSIEGGLGEITVNLPAEMGVRVEMDTALVSVTATGLTKTESGYVNRAYGAAPYTLTLKMQAGVGSVILVAP